MPMWEPSRMSPGASSPLHVPGRVQVEVADEGSMQSKFYPAPTQGLFSNTSLSQPRPGTAIQMENFWPSASTVIPRGGYVSMFTPGTEGKYLFEYSGDIDKPFFVASTDGFIYEFNEDTTRVDVIDRVAAHVTDTDYSHVEVQTDGGIFLILVNGADNLLRFDGTDWLTITDKTSVTITGVDTSKLSHVWAYSSRIFYVEKSSLNVWYSGPNEVAGGLTKLPLTGVFNKGGEVLFGATWSGDSGAGLDDRCVFVTTKGEAAVYSGDPSSAETWSLLGVYDVGRPIHKNMTTNIGGDLIIGTDQGLIPLSAVVTKDPSELKLVAITYPIGDLWQQEINRDANQHEWRMTKWPTHNMLLISLPDTGERRPKCFAANLETGGWTQFVGWGLTDVNVLNNQLYMCRSNGEVVRGFVGGKDGDKDFTCKLALPFDDLGGGGLEKGFEYHRQIWEHTQTITIRESFSVNYVSKFPTTPLSDVAPSEGANTAVNSPWDTSPWDTSFWSDEDAVRSKVQNKLTPISGRGFSISLQTEVLSGTEKRVNANIVGFHLGFKVFNTITDT